MCVGGEWMSYFDGMLNFVAAVSWTSEQDAWGEKEVAVSKTANFCRLLWSSRTRNETPGQLAP